MSGPKTYSCKVFNKLLLKLFLQQGVIDNLWKLLRSRRIIDHQRDVEINNEAFIRANISNYQELSAMLDFSPGQTLGQGQFDNLYNRVQKISNHQQKMKKAIEKQHKEFDRLEKAYQDFLDLGLLKEALDEEFTSLKKQMIDYLQTLIIDEDDKQKTISKLAAIQISFTLPAFSVEMAEDVDGIRQKMMASYDYHKKQIGAAGRITRNSKAGGRKKAKVKTLLDENLSAHNVNADFDFAATLSSINIAIAKLKPDSQANIFINRLQKIMDKQENQQPYFLLELLEDLKKHSDQHEKRETLQKLSRALPKGSMPIDVLAEIEKVKKNIKLLLQDGQIKNDDLASIRHSINKMQEKQAACLREQQYIKLNIVASLNELNYTVANDTEVIDLERKDDFLLSIPGQPNFLNLRFDAFGNVLYNFLIPDEPGSLSYDEKSIKFAEMEETCTAFKQVLGDLKNRGLNIDLQNEIQITEKALIALPKKYHSQMHQEKTSKSEKRKPGSAHRKAKK